MAKLKMVGYNNFALRLSGNPIPIRKGVQLDHRWSGPALDNGSDAFHIYENGGATACYTYFTIYALQKLG